MIKRQKHHTLEHLSHDGPPDGRKKGPRETQARRHCTGIVAKLHHHNHHSHYHHGEHHKHACRRVVFQRWPWLKQRAERQTDRQTRQTRPDGPDPTRPTRPTPKPPPPPKSAPTLYWQARSWSARTYPYLRNQKGRQTKTCVCVCPVLDWWKKFHRPGQTGPGRNPLPRSAHTMPPGGPEGQLEPPQSTPEGGRGHYVQNVWPRHKQQENEKQESESRRPE